LIFKNPYWCLKTKFELLEKWILVQSVIYYELGQNVASDYVYDSNSKQLAEMIRGNAEEHKESKWYYVFSDYQGGTGFDLYSQLNGADQTDIMEIARYIARTLGRKPS